MNRRIPRPSELAEFIRLEPIPLSATTRRLNRVVDVEDLRALAQKRVPKAVFDYVDGGAGAEISLRRARQAFEQITFRPRVLRDVSKVNTSTCISGQSAELPVVLAPTGFTRLMHHEGELAVARAAARAGVPYTLSTMGTRSIEEVAAEIPNGRRWFQIFLMRDRSASLKLIDCAHHHGYDTLTLTVDTPAGGHRQRDVRNGLSIPPALRVATLFNAALHPRWWINYLTTEPLQFASHTSWDRPLAELATHMFDPTMMMRDVELVRNRWPGRLAVKGIQRAEDAQAVVDAGADTVIVSSHGGRQLDRTAAPLITLREVVTAVGDRAEVIVDGGVRTGGDVAAALALGADSVMLGRPYLYGLMAGGQQGVERMLDILRAELTNTMQLLGAADVTELTMELLASDVENHAARAL